MKHIHMKSVNRIPVIFEKHFLHITPLVILINLNFQSRFWFQNRDYTIAFTSGSGSNSYIYHNQRVGSDFETISSPDERVLVFQFREKRTGNL